jgi:N-hydroxyarylamine O-acetyltransferase
MNNIDQKSPKLAAYLERIGFYGTARPDLETLRELQRTHVRAVPFENLVVQRRTGDTHLSLRGRVLTTVRKTGEEKIKLASVDEFVAALRDRFDLDVPEAAALWPAICARHDALFEDSES